MAEQPWLQISTEDVPLGRRRKEGGVDRILLHLQDGFPDGYHNELEDQPIAKVTHPPAVTWKQGKVKPLRINFVLRAGLDDVPTPERLVQMVETLFSWALPPSSSSGSGEKDWHIYSVYVLIGAGDTLWFKRRGVVESVDVKFLPPWDVETGMPYNAEVDLVIRAMFAKRTRLEVNTRTLPRSPWGFDKDWGARSAYRPQGGGLDSRKEFLAEFMPRLYGIGGLL